MADFFRREQISSDGLEQAGAEAGVRAPEGGIDDDLRFLFDRLRDQHDVYHVVTGYGRDLRGEAAVLAFSGIQQRSFGVAFMPLYVLFKAGWRSEIGKLIRDGFRRGWRARWLVDTEWEKQMDRPLDELRDALGLGPPPVYEAIRSEGAPELAASA
jgi:ubiquinone biosynthesis protein COQ4